MRNTLVEIYCRKCLYHTHVKSHSFIKPDLEPRLRQKILEERMFTFVCPICHEEVTFIHPCLYHDTKYHFIIYMGDETKDTSALEKQFPTSKIRIVSNPKQLKEMILMLEDGFDDQILHAIKQRLKRQDVHVQEIYYHDYDSFSKTIWFCFQYKDDFNFKAIHENVYRSLLRDGKGDGI
ncbi:MAG: hypothetical protein HFF02_07250 [Erysipelotrichaceae bacterium]|nr:hypothetical protein [Erysipelotrichaceae bacterium]